MRRRLNYANVTATLALFFAGIQDYELRLAAARAYNMMAADLFHGLEDRLTPAAYIPMRTPKDAIDELEFVVMKLGLKAVMMESLIRRPIKMCRRPRKLPSAMPLRRSSSRKV